MFKDVKYTLFNPNVTSFTVEGFDLFQVILVMINMDIPIRKLFNQSVVNGFIADEDMKRFVTYGSTR